VCMWTGPDYWFGSMPIRHLLKMGFRSFASFNRTSFGFWCCGMKGWERKIVHAMKKYNAQETFF